MKNLLLVLLLTVSVSSFVYCGNTHSKDQFKNKCSINNTDTWILVCLEGKWWWVIYNEDGSIRVQIPADF